MESLSRRNALRTVAAAGLATVGAPVIGGAALTPASAGRKVFLGTPHVSALHGLPTSMSYTLATGVPHFGMSAPVDQWDRALASVGAGVTSRRIFADLGLGANNQLSLVASAHRAGLLPVISYKVGGDVEGAIAGKFDAVAAEAAAHLASFDKPTAVTFWHEPHGNMTPAQYVAASRRILPAFKIGHLKVGPLLNGWLLDAQVGVFESYTSAELFALWDWFGLDTYESGTITNPGPAKPATRIRAARSFLDARGINLPLGIGEYNGYSAQSIFDVSAALLNTRDVWFGCLWNASGGKGHALEGERLYAYSRSLSLANNERRIAVREARRAARRAARQS